MFLAATTAMYGVGAVGPHFYTLWRRDRAAHRARPGWTDAQIRALHHLIVSGRTYGRARTGRTWPPRTTD
jgi:hypothetical protein